MIDNVVLRTPQIRSACEWLAENILETNAANDLERLAHGLLDVKAASAALSNVRRALESEIAARMESNELMLDGVGLLERRYSTKRSNWDHAAIASKLLAEAPKLCILDRSTGEVEGVEEALVRIFLQAAGISYWKLTPLRGMGLDPDAYCVLGDSEVSISVKGAK